MIVPRMASATSGGAGVMFASIAGRFCLCAASPCDPRDVGSQRPDLGRPLTVGRNLLNLISIFTSGGSLMSGFFESHLPIAGRGFRHQADHHLPIDNGKPCPLCVVHMRGASSATNPSAWWRRFGDGTVVHRWICPSDTLRTQRAHLKAAGRDIFVKSRGSAPVVGDGGVTRPVRNREAPMTEPRLA
jgi:hypothetical protein